MTTLDQALAQMAAHDMPPLDRARVTGRIERYGPKKRAWYVLREYRTRDGTVVITGAFGMWGRLEATPIEVDWRGINAEERARLQAEQAATEAREAQKREERARLAANRARQQWEAANRIGGSAYLTRKKVTPEPALRFMADGTLLVPAIRYDGKPRLVGLQKIGTDGTKRFNAGMAKAGAACRLGPSPKDGETLLVAEGVATALSLRMALERKVTAFVAFDCYGLEAVTKTLRGLYPASLIVICADDDYLTPGNPGLTKARAAAAEIGNAVVMAPRFTERADEAKLTDFNDLHCAEGLEAVAQQLREAFRAPPSSTHKTEAGPAPSSPRAVRVLARLLKHYVLLRGTDTVYDGENREILTVGALRLAEGRAAVNFWIDHPDRRTVLQTRVVFDPTGAVDPSSSINLFDPAEITRPSAAGDCARLLELLQYLCGEAGQDQAPITDWVLKWFAYPLQHIGAKMQTAVVFAGPEGTGKNMICGAVRDIYGRYGGIITQSELESQYTEWRSRKLFIVANEVLTRAEMRHQVGKLKNLVTEGELPIDAKYMPLRYEANHMNLVFLSNELQPLFISKGDRRYVVIRTPRPMPDDEYVAIARELAGGGVAAFHDYLLGVDTSDFAPWAKPPMTQAKEALIELGLSSVELFHREWSTGLTPWPYCAALSDDVYAAYRRFCEIAGERSPSKANRFWPELMSLADGAIKPILRVHDPGAPDAPARQRTVFVVGWHDEGQDKREWLRGHVRAFRDALREVK